MPAGKEHLMSDLAPLAEAVAVDPLVGHPPDFHVFQQFIERCKNLPAITTAVVWPMSEVALKGAVEAAQAGLIEPTLIGDEPEMKALAAEDRPGYRCLPHPSGRHGRPCRRDSRVAMCRAGGAQALMKGSLHTDELLKPAMARDTGLRTARRISHVFIMDTPAYARTLLITDAAINIKPEFEDKIHIVQNAIDLAHALGIPEPKVALLSAIETVNPKIPSTMEAAALCKMADRGQITGGILDGPLAFDTAVSAKAAKIKKLQSRPSPARPTFWWFPILRAATCWPSSLNTSAARSLPESYSAPRCPPSSPAALIPRNPPDQLRRGRAAALCRPSAGIVAVPQRTAG